MSQPPPHADPSMPRPPDASAAGVRATLRRLGPAGVLAVIAGTLPPLGGFLLLGFMGPIAEWLKSHQDVGPLLYVIGFMLLAGFALLPTYAQSILGGYAFGVAIGLPAALLGFGGAATIAYLIARRASGDRVVRLIEEHVKWRAVYESLLRRGFWRTLLIVTLLRLPPNSPFALTNLVLASTRTSPAAFLLGTLVGMAPRTSATVFIGAGLNQWSTERLESPWLFGIGMAVTIAVIIVIGRLANQALSRVTGAPAAAPADPPTDAA